MLLLLTLPSAYAAEGEYYIQASYKHHKTGTLPEQSLRIPGLKSATALIINQDDGTTIYEKNINYSTPIASITKLMTSMVVLDANLPLDETVTISRDDVDTIKYTGSRLSVGTTLSRRDMLRLALMSSENRAAAALGRNYPGGTSAFVEAMNRKAAEIGMTGTHFIEPTGLNSQNVSTAPDLVRMVEAAYKYPLIRKFTTTSSYIVTTASGRRMEFRNSNRLVKNPDWEIGLSKTGYISEAGRCLVMQTKIAARSVVIVLLDSWGKYTRLADANRIKRWLEARIAHEPTSPELANVSM